LIRRRYEEQAPAVSIGGLVVDAVARRATLGGQPLDLTAREYALLEYLALRRGSTVTREEIEDHIYGVNKLPSSNAIDSAICLLRSKMGDEGKGLIRTRRGQGYVLDEPGS
jgi:DNA-binding response OmpR family regulator